MFPNLKVEVKFEEQQNIITPITKKWDSCQYCHKTFNSKLDLKVHKKQHHYRKNKYQCSVCHLYLSSEKILNQHKKLIHPTQNAPESLKSPESLTQHPSITSNNDDSNPHQLSNSTTEINTPCESLQHFTFTP